MIEYEKWTSNNKIDLKNKKPNGKKQSNYQLTLYKAANIVPIRPLTCKIILSTP